MIDSKWSACGPWCDNYVPGRLANFCVDVNETDGAEWEPAAVEAITHAAEKVCQVAGMNPGLHEAAVHRMRRASGLALGGAA